jgi:hypothetical protein
VSIPDVPWSDRDLNDCFKMPSGFTITGRTSSIRNVFVAAIVPLERPCASEIEEVLQILQLNPTDLKCSYCGSVATEWDHLRPLVENGRPTGYPSSIRNLVPSCGKCNQSKGKSDWKTWMLGPAKLSPTTRGIKDIAVRVARLQEYETWASCSPLPVETLVTPDLWEKYYALQGEILKKMQEAQKLASEITQQIKSKLPERATSAVAGVSK